MTESGAGAGIEGFDVLAVLGHPVVVTDPAGTVVFWNAAAERRFRTTATEAVGQLLVDLIDPHVALSNRPLYDDDGDLVGVVAEAEPVEGPRLASLQAVAEGLAAATTPAEVIDVIVQQGSAVLGGRTGSLCLVDADGETFELVREVGYTEGIVEKWHRFPIAAELPAGDAVRSGEIVFLGSIEERDRRYPVFAGLEAAAKAFAVVPLILPSGRPVGVFTVGFGDERDFDDDDEREFLRSLGTLCAQAIDRAQLFAAMATARTGAEGTSSRLAFLAEATGRLAATLHPEATASALADLVVPRLGDVCAIVVLDYRGAAEPLLVRHRDPARDAEFAERMRQYPFSPASLSGVGDSLRTGEAKWFPEARPGRFLDKLGLGAAAVIPLEARGRVIGGLAIANDAGRPMPEADFLLAQELAVRGGLTLDRARLFAERTLVAETLQSSLLPPVLPEIPGVDLGAAYVAAGSEVGGDFYDAFAIDESRWLVTIGDVRGKGIEAAQLTSLARHTIRSAAITGVSPSGILRHLNEMLLRSHTVGDFEPRFCTVAVAVLGLGEGGAYELTVAAGGHPLPVLWADGRLTELGQAGTIMGVVPDVDVYEHTYPLAPGDTIVMFTDGVSERRNGVDFFDQIGLLGALDAAAPDARAAAIAQSVQVAVRNFADAALNDDMAVLVLKTCR